MVRPFTRLKRLLFEKLEQRFVCDSGIGIQVNVGSQVIGQDFSPQFPVNSELQFDIQVANQSQQIYDDLAMNLRLGSQAAITALPVLVPSVARLQPNPVKHGQANDIASVSFSADSMQLALCSFLVVCYHSNEGDVGYYLNVEDFLDPANPVTEK